MVEQSAGSADQRIESRDREELASEWSHTDQLDSARTSVTVAICSCEQRECVCVEERHQGEVDADLLRSRDLLERGVELRRRRKVDLAGERHVNSFAAFADLHVEIAHIHQPKR